MDEILEMPIEKQVELFPSRVRRKFKRQHINNHKLQKLFKKLAEAKEKAAQGTRPKAVRTHYRNMVVLPEMIGSVIAVHNGKVFMEVEIKPDMVGHYLGEFAITYKPVTHGKYGATLQKVSNSKFFQVNY